MAGALSHLTVVELCDDVPGAACGRQFAAWGADVTVLEPPGGSALRRAAPWHEAHEGEPTSLLWEYLAAGKRTRAVEAGDGGTGAVALRLAERADVFITDWPAARLDAAGLSFSGLAHAAPGFVVLSVTPFGSGGPYADFQATDLILQALSGFMVLNGVPDREPLKAAGTMAMQALGVSAFVGALAALNERERSGRGQVVEVACFEALTSLVPLLRSEYSGVDAVRQGGPVSGTFMFPCGDGFISLNPTGGRNWEDLLVALGADLAALPPELRGADVSPNATKRYIEEHAPSYSARDLFTRLNELRIACGLANGPADLLRDRQLEARGYFFDIDHPRLGKLRFPGPPARMSATPMAAPASVRSDRDVGHPSARPVPAAPTSRGGGGEGHAPPLAGVRVLDLTAAWLGTYATMLLADLGADLIKVESPSRPDVWRGANVPRRAPPAAGSPSHWISYPTNPDAHPWNVNANFNSVNRNKRSLALDLARAEGRDLFLRLVADADLVMENFTPRVMANFGLDYDTLRRVNPRLVMVSFSGFGSFGPYRDFRANGATTDTTCGWAALTGYRDGPPTMMGAMEADPTTGLQMAATALVALSHARRTGIGQHLDGSMFETCVGYIGEELLLAGLANENPRRDGNRHRAMVPHGVFPCAGEDEWIAIAVRDDRDWQALRAVAGGDMGFHDERLATQKGRQRYIDDLEDRLRRWTASWSAHELMRALQRGGVPAGVVQNYRQVLDDPQLTSRGWFEWITHPDMGNHRYNGFPWRFSRTPAVVHRPPPRVGEHSGVILREELDLSDEQIRHLFAQSVIDSVLSRSVSLSWVSG
jgi:crotonobetainyl-CoA:carnitine CoA-transferase CaiB-like acyl-CoA transferase